MKKFLAASFAVLITLSLAAAAMAGSSADTKRADDAYMGCIKNTLQLKTREFLKTPKNFAVNMRTLADSTNTAYAECPAQPKPNGETIFRGMYCINTAHIGMLALLKDQPKVRDFLQKHALLQDSPAHKSLVELSQCLMAADSSTLEDIGAFAKACDQEGKALTLALYPVAESEGLTRLEAQEAMKAHLRKSFTMRRCMLNNELFVPMKKAE